MKRKYDYRRVKSNRPYTLATLAKLFGVHSATVRGWIKKDGLSVAVVGQSHSIILHGAKVKAWMKAREKAKRRPCAPDEMFCTRCKEPRKIAEGSFRIKSGNTQKVTAIGDCIICGLTLRNFNIASNLDDLKRRYDPKDGND